MKTASNTVTGPVCPESPLPGQYPKPAAWELAMQKLGGWGIIISVLVIPVSLFLLFGDPEVSRDTTVAEIRIIGSVSLCIGLLYLGAGIGAFMKKPWAIGVLLALGYVGLINGLIGLIAGGIPGIIGFWLVIMVLVNGHKALALEKQRKRMRRAGHPGTTDPAGNGLVVKLSCPHCTRHIEAGEEWAGASANCPSCGGGFRVPAREEWGVPYGPPAARSGGC